MSAITQLCPYCDIRPRNSGDHIFPEFLGGRTTIRTDDAKIVLLVLPIALNFLWAPAAAPVRSQRRKQIPVSTGK